MRRFNPTRVSGKRRKLGLTQLELAESTGISAVSVSAIERGKKEPRAGTISRLARSLGCRVDYFFTA